MVEADLTSPPKFLSPPRSPRPPRETFPLPPPPRGSFPHAENAESAEAEKIGWDGSPNQTSPSKPLSPPRPLRSPREAFPHTHLRALRVLCGQPFPHTTVENAAREDTRPPSHATTSSSRGGTGWRRGQEGRACRDRGECRGSASRGGRRERRGGWSGWIGSPRQPSTSKPSHLCALCVLRVRHVPLRPPAEDGRFSTQRMRRSVSRTGDLILPQRLPSSICVINGLFAISTC